MCVALPSGPSAHKAPSKLWQFIRSTPLNMLLFSVLIQSIIFLFLSLLVSRYWPEYTLPDFESYLFYALFWIFPFVSYALVMNYYPYLCRQGPVEYLQYASLNTIGNINLILFYLSSVFFSSFVSVILLLQLITLVYAFKPIWRMGFWAGKNQSFLVRSINFASLLVALSLFLTLLAYSFNLPWLAQYAPYLSLFQLLIISFIITSAYNSGN